MKENKYIQNDRLRRIRERRGWTQKDVADHIHLPDARMLRRWENGEAFPSLRYRAKLCEVFQQSPEDLGLIMDREPRERVAHSLTAETRGRAENRLPPVLTLPPMQRPFEAEQQVHLGVVMVIMTVVGTISILLPLTWKRVRHYSGDV